MRKRLLTFKEFLLYEQILVDEDLFEFVPATTIHPNQIILKEDITNENNSKHIHRLPLPKYTQRKD
jgi:hypothetical protein